MFVHIHIYLFNSVSKWLLSIKYSSIYFVPWKRQKCEISFQWQILRVMWRSLNTTFGFFLCLIPKPVPESWASAGGKPALLCWAGVYRSAAECTRVCYCYCRGRMSGQVSDFLPLLRGKVTVTSYGQNLLQWGAKWGTKLREAQWTYSSSEKEKMDTFFTVAVFSCFFMLPDHKLSLRPSHCVHSFHFLHSAALSFPSFFTDTLFFRWKSFPFPMYILSFIFHVKTNFSIFMLAFLICTGWFLLFLSP